MLRIEAPGGRPGASMMRCAERIGADQVPNQLDAASLATEHRRVAVFIDARNVYYSARLAFHGGTGPSSHGQVDPIKLGELLVERGQGPARRPKELVDVRVYVGKPSESRDPISAGAYARQVDSWRRAGVHVIEGTLAYPDDFPAHPPKEKGVDVALAVDLVAGSLRDEFDVAVIASTDNDLLPALQALVERRDAWGRPGVEVFAWSPLGKRLWLKKRSLWCHFLDRSDYDRVRDARDYVAR